MAFIARSTRARKQYHYTLSDEEAKTECGMKLLLCKCYDYSTHISMLNRTLAHLDVLCALNLLPHQIGITSN